MRRFWLQNSEEVSTLEAKVCNAMLTLVLKPIGDPWSFDLRKLAKKYFALPLWITSKSVPTTTRMIIRIRYPCMTTGGMVADNSANGLSVNINASLTFSIYPLYMLQRHVGLNPRKCINCELNNLFMVYCRRNFMQYQ